MVAVTGKRDRNQPTFKPTKAAPANSSRVEMPVAERLAVAWLLGEGRTWRGFTGVGGGGFFGVGSAA